MEKCAPSTTTTATLQAKSANDCWLLHGQYYDFTEFVERHPGGRRAIMLGKGRDCTALFESYHTNLPQQKLLDKYRVEGVKPALKDSEAVAGEGFTFKEGGFYRTVKERTRQYFKDNGITHTKANAFSVITFIANIIGLVYCTWSAFVYGNVIAAILHGILRALMIIRPNHAASHYALFTSPWLNQWAYRLCMFFSGSSPLQWTLKHVIAHHLDTNISPMDEDTMYPIKRILPGLKRLVFHKFQHIYIWIVYPLTTSFWTISNIIKMYPFFTDGVVYEGINPVPHTSAIDWAESWLTLVGFVCHRMLLPFIMLPFDQALLVFIASEIACSAWFALQFAVSHEVEEAVSHTFHHKNEKDDGSIRDSSEQYAHGCGKNNEDWGEHQVRSAHNYSPDSWLSLNLSGGLNLQIEHHLFPSVHYHHYPALARIVQQACKEYNIPYVASSTFMGALQRHYNLMKKMGSSDSL